jgi:hypothetical protein
MKKIVYLLFVGLFFTSGYSQEKNKKKEDIYIYVNNSRFIGAVLGYKAYFSITSNDKRFQSDNYYFKIPFHGLDYQSLYSLGTPTNLDNIDVVKPEDYFKNKTNCELHTEFSLYKQIYIITDIPKHRFKHGKNKTKKYIMFYAKYRGSVKNIVHTNMTSKNLIDE